MTNVEIILKNVQAMAALKQQTIALLDHEYSQHQLHAHKVIVDLYEALESVLDLYPSWYHDCDGIKKAAQALKQAMEFLGIEVQYEEETPQTDSVQTE